MELDEDDLVVAVLIQVVYSVFGVGGAAEHLCQVVVVQGVGGQGVDGGGELPADEQFPHGVRAALELADHHRVDGGAVALDDQRGGVAIRLDLPEDVEFQGLTFCRAVPEEGDGLVGAVVVQVGELDGLEVGAGEGGGVLQTLIQDVLQTGLQALIFRGRLGQLI